MADGGLLRIRNAQARSLFAKAVSKQSFSSRCRVSHSLRICFSCVAHKKHYNGECWTRSGTVESLRYTFGVSGDAPPMFFPPSVSDARGDKV
jgi:hypothetical protein